MKEDYSSIRRACRPRDHCQLLFKGRKTAGILMAIPFVVCFALFGIFNLIGGTVLTSMACKPKFPKHTILIIQKLLQEQSKKMETYLDPMKVVGIILLTTGSLLVLVGILLGIVACRSINFDYNSRTSSRRRTSWASFSGVHQLSSANGPVTSFAVMANLSNGAKTRSKLTKEDSCRTNKTSASSTVKTVVDIDVHVVEEVSASANGGHPRHTEEVTDSDTCVVLPENGDRVSIRSMSKKNCCVSWAASVSPNKNIPRNDVSTELEEKNADAV